MSRPDGVPEWAWEESVRIAWPIIWLNADAEQSAHNAIARALVAAERRGIAKAADVARAWWHSPTCERPDMAIRKLGEAE